MNVELFNMLKDRGLFTSSGKPNGRFTESLDKKYPELYSKLMEEEGDTLMEKIYLLSHERTYCQICGKYTQFVKYSDGYMKTCSPECTSKLRGINTSNNLKGRKRPKEVIEKRKATIEKKKLEGTYDMVGSVRRTNLEKYGKAYYFETDDFKRKSLETLIVKNGSTLSFDDIAHLDYNEAKFLALVFSRSGGRIPKTITPKFSPSEYKGVYSALHGAKDRSEVECDTDINVYYYPFHCEVCGTDFESSIADGRVPMCPHCNPPLVSTSKGELELGDFIESLGFNVERNYRDLEGKTEVDIYVPERRLALEYNGLYWHSSIKNTNKDYHLKKTRMCEKSGIRLIHVFEDEWKQKNDIVKSIVSTSLGVYSNRLYARQCDVREVTKEKELCNRFLDANHLQGRCGFSKAYGLFHNNELVSLLTLSKPRFTNTNSYSWEIIRFATKLNTQIVGGFSKLFKHFLDDTTGNIITYSDRTHFSGGVYRNNGFTELEPTVPDFCYLTETCSQRLSRYSMQGKDTSNLPRLYGCGNWKFEYIRAN